MKRLLLLRAGVALLTLASAAGCASVEPWERDVLAKPHMALDPHPARTAMLDHVRSSREAATGGVTKSGGGCGCD
jgi:hypothetical protein